MLQAGLFGLSEHLNRLSAHQDPLEELGADHRIRGVSPGSDRRVGLSRRGHGRWMRWMPILTGSSKNPAISPWAGRSLMRRWCLRPRSETPRLKRTPSRRARPPARYGLTSLRGRRRRTPTRAGRSSSPRAARRKTVSRRSTSPASATRAACRSAGPLSSTANAKSSMRPGLTGGCCAMSLPAIKLLRMSGPIPPITVSQEAARQAHV